MTGYKMFIDDERFPAERMDIFRSYGAAVSWMESHGCPSYISFDHDLADEKTGYDIAKWIVDTDIELDGKFMPDDFSFYVHSQNPVGRDNINALIKGYIRHKNGGAP